MTMVFKEFNVRQLQAYAGLCLWQFCEQLGFRHSSIDELILHLISVLSADSLSEWEQRGAALAITGRGDELPQSVVDIFKAHELEVFNSLVECCVEVGIVDMYGASTDQPLKFLKNCVEILQRVTVKPPEPEVLGEYRRGSDAWGEPLSDADVNRILERYGVGIG